jgi:hypothetical protein
MAEQAPQVFGLAGLFFFRPRNRFGVRNDRVIAWTRFRCSAPGLASRMMSDADSMSVCARHRAEQCPTHDAWLIEIDLQVLM